MVTSHLVKHQEPYSSCTSLHLLLLSGASPAEGLAPRKRRVQQEGRELACWQVPQDQRLGRLPLAQRLMHLQLALHCSSCCQGPNQKPPALSLIVIESCQSHVRKVCASSLHYSTPFFHSIQVIYHGMHPHRSRWDCSTETDVGPHAVETSKCIAVQFRPAARCNVLLWKQRADTCHCMLARATS